MVLFGNTEFMNIDKIAANIVDRLSGLDILRSLFMLFVLIGCGSLHAKLDLGKRVVGQLCILVVELFFVVNGFLIGSIIMRLIDHGRFNFFAGKPYLALRGGELTWGRFFSAF